MLPLCQSHQRCLQANTRLPLQHTRGISRAPKRRYVVLSDGVLSWYDSEKATKPNNALPITDSVTKIAPAPSAGRQRFAFTITFPASAQHAPIHLEAETEGEREAWLAVLPRG